MRGVRDVVDKWDGIASCLKVKTIDKIRIEYWRAERQMIAVLSTWLKGQTLEGRVLNPSWKGIVQIVADRVGEEDPTHTEHTALNCSGKPAYCTHCC